MSYLPRLLPILLLAAFTSPVWAGGPAPYEIGTPDLGLASAGWAARAQDAATVATNPAGMTRLDRSQVLVGVQPAYTDIHFDTASATFGGNNGGNAGGFTPGGGLYYAASLAPDLRLGIGTIATVAGSLNYEKDWAGRYFSQRSVLTVMGITVPVAYRVNEWLSWAPVPISCWATWTKKRRSIIRNPAWKMDGSNTKTITWVTGVISVS